MAKKKKRILIPIIVFLSFLYIFLAAQPLRRETVLESAWITSLKTANTGNTQDVISPFSLNNTFGYIDASGDIILSKAQEGMISFSDSRWAEYEGIPEEIEIKSPLNETQFSLTNPNGYPFFMDDRIFILGKEQNSVSGLDERGTVLWTYDFDAPITCLDANAGLVSVGLLNGTVVLLDQRGKAVFSFDALGSRISVIYACKISDDGSRFALVSGLDEQRFLLFERYSDTYRVIYHEYIGEGFRRPVHLSFVDDDRRVAFERQEGVGIYDIELRQSVIVPLEGTVYAFDTKGSDDMFFIITALDNQEKNLVSIRYPGTIVGKAPFYTDSAVLIRNNSALIIGGGDTLISFELKKR
jgi:hypothetical protein